MLRNSTTFVRKVMFMRNVMHIIMFIARNRRAKIVLLTKEYQ